MLDNRNIALYIRVAHKDDEAAAQESMLRKYAEDNGYRDVVVYVDNGVSGIGFDRPSLNRLQNDIETDLVKRVIVKDISRISRSFLEVPGWFNGIMRYLVSFTSIMDGMNEETFEQKDVLFQLLLEHQNKEETATK